MQYLYHYLPISFTKAFAQNPETIKLFYFVHCENFKYIIFRANIIFFYHVSQMVARVELLGKV